MSSNNPIHRQNAIEYIRRTVELAAEVGATYMLIVPGAAGRLNSYNGSEWLRSVESLEKVADSFTEYHVQGALEPIRVDEVSIVHFIADAKKYIEKIASAGIRSINGDTFHMQFGEDYITKAILDAGDMLINLHMADSNRRALGMGFLDFDAMIMSLYCLGYNLSARFATPEPLRAAVNPYHAMYSVLSEDDKNSLVAQTIGYFRTREEWCVHQQLVENNNE